MKSDNRKRLAIIGYHDGAAGQVETWLEDVTDYDIDCFVVTSDEFIEPDVEVENRKRASKRTAFPINGILKGYPLIASYSWVDMLRKRKIESVLSLEPDNSMRRQQIEIIESSGFELATAIHPSALIMHDAIVEKGSWINAGAVIGYKAEIHKGVIINTGAQIDHHNVIEECAQVDPGAVTAGNVCIRSMAHIHTGAILINKVEIGEGAVIGAGAVVIGNINPYTVAVGNPARVIKNIQTK